MLIPPGFLAIGGDFWLTRRTDASNGIQGSVVDSSKNLYTTGTNSDSTSILIAKHNLLGQILFQRRLTPATGTFNSGQDVVLDSSNNVYMTGQAQLNAGQANRGVIAKYNNSGVLQWQQTLTITDGELRNNVAIDSSNNLYLSGYRSDGGFATFVLNKINTSGAIQWQREISIANTQFVPRNLTTDNSGNIIVVSSINSFTITPKIHIVKYNSSGTLQWQKELLGSAETYPGDVATDSSGNIYVVGFTVISGSGNMILVKYNSSGVLQWQRRMAFSDITPDAYEIAIDSLDDIYLAASSYLIKYNSSGVLQWQRNAPGGALRAISVDDEAIYGGQALTFRLPKDGSLTGTYSVAGTNYTYSQSSISETSASLTEATPSYTSSTVTGTVTATSLTDASTSFSYAITNI